jgi:hypothetical protein
MQRIEVILAWNATGQVCDENAVRICNGTDPVRRFDTVDEAKTFCQSVLFNFPFVGCQIRSEDGRFSQLLISSVHGGPTFQLPVSTAKYRLRLFECLSGAHVDVEGQYIDQDTEEFVHEFDSYKSAKRFGDSLMVAHPHVEPWIYGPDGAVMRRGRHECKMNDTCNGSVPISWWRSLLRGRKAEW